MNTIDVFIGLLKQVLLPAFIGTVLLVSPAAVMPKLVAAGYILLVCGLLSQLVWQTVSDNNPPRWLQRLGW